MINFVVALTTTSRGPFPTYWRGFKEETLKSHGTWECVDCGTFSCFFLSTGKTGRHFFGYSARENRKKRLVFSHLCAQQVHTQNESLLCIFRVVLIFRILEKGTFSHRFKKKRKPHFFFVILNKGGRKCLGWLRRQSPFFFLSLSLLLFSTPFWRWKKSMAGVVSSVCCAPYGVSPSSSSAVYFQKRKCQEFNFPLDIYDDCRRRVEC